MYAKLPLIINSYDKTAEKQERIAKAAVEVFDKIRVFHFSNQTYAQVCSQIIISIVKNEKAFGKNKNKRLKFLVLLYLEKFILDKIDLQQISLKWAMQKRRRIAVNQLNNITYH